MTSSTGRGPLLDRRQFAFGGSALAAASLVWLGGRPALAASTTHSFKLGSTEITVLSDGIFSLPTSILLPSTPKADIEALFKAHAAKLEIALQTNVTLVRRGTTVALIDTGAGPDFMPTLGRMPDTLEGLGIKADDVTHVIFTHAHADHFWGVVDPFGEPTRWPKARHLMAAPERDFWLADGAENKVPAFQKGMTVGITRRLKELGDRITPVNPDAEVAPGIAYLPTTGHTPGHCSVVVRDGSEELVVLGDALTHAAVSFGAPTWRWGSDIDPDSAIASRKALLDRLASSKAQLIGYHLPWPGVGRAERAGTSYRYVAG